MTRQTIEVETASSDTPDDVDLQVPLRTVCFIAELARDLMGKSASTAEEDDGDDELAAEILEDRGTDAVEEELRSLIDDLDEEAQIDLVALMWFGREDDDWAALRRIASEEHTNQTAGYLLGTPLLSDYLMAGLDRLGLDCSEAAP
jgi:hypothetical protein